MATNFTFVSYNIYTSASSIANGVFKIQHFNQYYIILTMNKLLRLFILACVLQTPMLISAQDRYRWTDELSLLSRIDLLPQYRQGSIVETFSSYDRTHGNDDGFAGTYSFIRKEGSRLVIAEMEGPGVIDRIWTPTPNETMLHFYFDGSKNPSLSIRFSDLFSGKVYPFVKPICGNEVGGFYCYVPITYRKSCKIVYDGPKLEFIQIGYRSLPGMKVETFSPANTAEEHRALDSVSRLWQMSEPAAEAFAEGRSGNVRVHEQQIVLNPGDDTDIFSMDSPGRIVGIEIDGGTSFEGDYKDVVISSRWDDDTRDAVMAPLQDFFGYAFGNPAMRGLLMGRHGTVNYCFMPMPFDRRARLSLHYRKRGEGQPTIVAKVKIHYSAEGRRADEGRFYTVWRREKTPIGSYHTFVDHRGRGHYVGTILQSQGLRPGMTLFFEGDDSTHVDGRMRIHGTGSEDYFNGGWYALLDRWDRGISLPLHGSLDYSLPMARTGGYRMHVSDKMSFEQNIYHGMEHGGQNNDFPVDYTSLAMLYSDNAPMGATVPEGELLHVYKPDVHIYFPQLFDMTVDGDIQLTREKGITMTTHGLGQMRLMLYDVPEGRYRLKLDLTSFPEGGELQVWQRQKMLADWMQMQSKEAQDVNATDCGEIYITPQTNSITLHLRATDGTAKLGVRLITLERIR